MFLPGFVSVIPARIMLRKKAIKKAMMNDFQFHKEIFPGLLWLSMFVSDFFILFGDVFCCVEWTAPPELDKIC